MIGSSVGIEGWTRLMIKDGHVLDHRWSSLDSVRPRGGHNRWMQLSQRDPVRSLALATPLADLGTLINLSEPST